MNLREILANDLVKRLENDAEVLGIVSANDLLDKDVYGEDKIKLLEKARYSASDVETSYFFSTSVEKELKEIFEKYCQEDDSFYDFLNEICSEFDLYRISESAFETQNIKNIAYIAELNKELEDIEG